MPDPVMPAVQFDEFGAAPRVAELPVPVAPPGGAVIRVVAAGLCRSDWHGWQGHDPDITALPHVPGHEFAGVVHEVGAGVMRVRVGDRVVVPFVCGCGQCPACRTGNAQVCPSQWQPGFSGPGCFAQYVAVPWADFNLVALPAQLSFEVGASLGCRFATAYRGIVAVAKVAAGETVAVFGCGGVGLAAVMIARSRGARVIAVDVDAQALGLARRCGAWATVRAGDEDPTAAVARLCPEGVQVSVDALGSAATAQAAVRCLAVQGRHLQIGLLPPATVSGRATVPMHVVIGRELAVLGSHGMAAAAYPGMLADITCGRIDPGLFIARTIGLAQVPGALMAMNSATAPGVTIIDPRLDADPTLDPDLSSGV